MCTLENGYFFAFNITFQTKIQPISQPLSITKFQHCKFVQKLQAYTGACFKCIYEDTRCACSALCQGHIVNVNILYSGCLSFLYCKIVRWNILLVVFGFFCFFCHSLKLHLLLLQSVLLFYFHLRVLLWPSFGGGGGSTRIFIVVF